MPRHPPFALNNLTTKNKMLASTVQFSTNDQPTTLAVPHQTVAPSPASSRGMKDQAMPGQSRKTNHQPSGLNGCFFRTQQGALRQLPAAPTPTFLETKLLRVLTVPAVA